MREAGIDQDPSQSSNSVHNSRYEHIPPPPMTPERGTPGSTWNPRSAQLGALSPGISRTMQSATPLSPRSRNNVKVANFTTEDSSLVMSNEQSQQFTLQIEAR